MVFAVASGHHDRAEIGDVEDDDTPTDLPGEQLRLTTRKSAAIVML